MEHRITVKSCMTVVAREHGLTVQQLLERTRRAAIARPRQIAMYLACKLTAASLPDIGQRFGGYDHTTIMYARDRIEAKAKLDPMLNAQIERLKKKLAAPLRLSEPGREILTNQSAA